MAESSPQESSGSPGPGFDAETVRRMATLARLRLAEEEIPPLVEHFGRMMEFVTVLAEGDDPAVEPFRLEPVLFEGLRGDAPIPAGEPGGPTSLEAWQRCAPEVEGPYFTVPRVVGGE
jgi:aspartyl-tRNA(Asn)/glutamyl-tRNA(Gln) amidotransferase subunit C